MSTLRKCFYKTNG